MGLYDAVISGSFALQFFERVFWKDSDMNVFIKKGAGADTFCPYLAEEEGYALAEFQG